MKITVYNQLKKYEMYLTTAYYSNYMRGISITDVEKLTAIGNELGIAFKYNHCPKCLLEFIKKLAKPYFEQKVKLEEKAKIKQINNSEEIDNKDEQENTNEEGSETAPDTRSNS